VRHDCDNLSNHRRHRHCDYFSGAECDAAALWKLIRWSQCKGEQLIAFVRPKVEEFANSHTRLADTATETLKEMTGHVGVIQKDIKEVRTELSGHGAILTRLDNRCQNHPPKVSDA